LPESQNLELRLSLQPRPPMLGLRFLAPRLRRPPPPVPRARLPIELDNLTIRGVMPRSVRLQVRRRSRALVCCGRTENDSYCCRPGVFPACGTRAVATAVRTDKAAPGITTGAPTVPLTPTSLDAPGGRCRIRTDRIPQTRRVGLTTVARLRESNSKPRSLSSSVRGANFLPCSGVSSCACDSIVDFTDVVVGSTRVAIGGY